jgi:hypothetical protein
MSREKTGRIVPALRSTLHSACIAVTLGGLLPAAGVVLGDADARFRGGTHHGYDHSNCSSASRYFGSTHDGYALAELTVNIPPSGTIMIIK